MLGLPLTDTARTVLLHLTSILNMGSRITSKDPSVLDYVVLCVVSFFYSNSQTAEMCLETYSRVAHRLETASIIIFLCLNGLKSRWREENIGNDIFSRNFGRNNNVKRER